MNDLLTHYAEKLENLSQEFSTIKEKESLVNELRVIESPTIEETKLLAEAHNQVVNWNLRVDNLVDTYKSLVKTYDLIIQDPSIYRIKQFE